MAIYEPVDDRRASDTSAQPLRANQSHPPHARGELVDRFKLISYSSKANSRMLAAIARTLVAHDPRWRLHVAAPHYAADVGAHAQPGIVLRGNLDAAQLDYEIASSLAVVYPNAFPGAEAAPLLRCVRRSRACRIARPPLTGGGGD